MEVQGYQCEICEKMRTKSDNRGDRWWVIFVTNSGVHLIPFEQADKTYKEMISRDVPAEIMSEYHLCCTNHMYAKLKYLIKDE